MRLYLPRARITDEAPPAAPAPREASSLEADPPREGLRILLVEDNGEVAAGTEALLSLLGHRVTYAANADDALALIDAPLDPEDESRPFDLVISDIHMPGTLNGIDLAEEIERRPGMLPVILVTGYAEELDRTRRVNARVLSKPFDIGLLDDMLHAIRQARDARKSGRIRA
ncbi:response regulator [Burkholderia gladioli]|uniref:response regulator n=1 Tax=Burkholderia gladioli TaxID=28095 RepID=UPI003C7D5425